MKSANLQYRDSVYQGQMAAVKMFYPTRILSASTASDMLEWLDMMLATDENNIIINLQNVLFMDSSGLGALVKALKKVRAAGKRMILCSLSGQARMLFEQAGMSSLFEIYSDLNEFNRAGSPLPGNADRVSS